jgi:putative FmdB family regulatory protein
MPTYEYECKKCLHRFDLRQKFAEHAGAACPKCGSQSQRLFSVVPIVFKGSGFYVTDCRDKAGSKSEAPKDKPDSKPKEQADNKAAKKVEGKAESKPENKSDNKPSEKPGKAGTAGKSANKQK